MCALRATRYSGTTVAEKATPVPSGDQVGFDEDSEESVSGVTQLLPSASMDATVA
jgi:hypothetical protein